MGQFYSTLPCYIWICGLWVQDAIHSLHLHIDSLKNQIGGLLDDAEAKDGLVVGLNQQLDAKDRRIRDLVKKLQDAEGQLADAASALRARDVLLKEREQDLADRDAEVATFQSGRQQQQLPQQQQPQQKLQRVGSVASTSHR